MENTLFENAINCVLLSNYQGQAMSARHHTGEVSGELSN